MDGWGHFISFHSYIWLFRFPVLLNFPTIPRGTLMNCTTNHQPPTTPLTLASRSRQFFEMEFALSNVTRGRTHQPVERTEGMTGKSWKQCSLSCSATSCPFARIVSAIPKPRLRASDSVPAVPYFQTCLADLTYPAYTLHLRCNAPSCSGGTSDC